MIESDLNKDQPVINKMTGLLLPWASTVEIVRDTSDTTKLKVMTLARSTKTSWLMTGTFNLDPQTQFSAPEGVMQPYILALSVSGKFTSFYKGKSIPKFKKEAVDKKGNKTQVDTLNPDDRNRQILEESPQTRIFVCGNSRFATDQFIQQTGGLNGNFIMNLMDWMTQDNDLITIRSKKIIDRPLEITTPAKRTALKWINIIIMPVLLIVFGVSRTIIRKKRQKTN
jgi:ABC-2 type transport system permease protein